MDSERVVVRPKHNASFADAELPPSQRSTVEADLNTTGASARLSGRAQMYVVGGGAGTGVGGRGGPGEKEKKIGHRRVDEAGQVTYKKKPTSELMAAIQLGIGQSVGRLTPKPKRDVLYEDFHIVETVFYPREGSNMTPAHRYSDFRFKTYAPVAFRYFRELFEIQPDDFLLSLCDESLQELSNPGASGSIFYITNDDEFIIKTVQKKEAEFLQKLLPGYYMNLNQNVRTLLPKFYGLYCYQCGGKNIRFVVMNNLLPTSVRMHSKFDLKGSTFKRRASKQELTKASPTYKDLDFREMHPEGIFLESETFTALLKTLERDCRVLQSFKIMDYSMLLGIHYIDMTVRDGMNEAETTLVSVNDSLDCSRDLSRHQPAVRQRLAQYSTAMESIQATAAPRHPDDSDVIPGGIPARTVKGERLILYIGIIDILQSYRFNKKLEHTFKSLVTDGDTISVHRPGFYAQRFLEFFTITVFKKVPSFDLARRRASRNRFKNCVRLALRHSPSKRKSATERQKSVIESEFTFSEKELMNQSANEFAASAVSAEQGATGGRPDVLPDSLTPLPPYSIRRRPLQSYIELPSALRHHETTRATSLTTVVATHAAVTTRAKSAIGDGVAPLLEDNLQKDGLSSETSAWPHTTQSRSERDASTIVISSESSTSVPSSSMSSSSVNNRKTTTFSSSGYTASGEESTV